MTEPIINTPVNASKPKSRKKLIALIAVGVLVVGGSITAAVVNSNAAYAAETTELCTVALNDIKAASTTSLETTVAADLALAAVKDPKLPKDAGTSTEYAKRVGAKAVLAVKPVKAVPASEGVKAVAEVKEVKAVAARPSGAELIETVLKDRNASAGVDAKVDMFEISCFDRDQAAALTAHVSKSLKATKTLEASMATLMADFAIFQTEETARIAAEKKAAAEAEAARVAAEAAAAQAAAEQAAADAAAWEAAQQWQAPAQSNYGGGGGNSGGGGGGSYTPPPANNGGSGGGGNIAPPPGQSGGVCPAGRVCYG